MATYLILFETHTLKNKKQQKVEKKNATLTG
jgi:hypothetical protein